MKKILIALFTISSIISWGQDNVGIGTLTPNTLSILDLSSNLCKENKRNRITIRDLEISVRNDEELNYLFLKVNNLSFLGGGVIPYIHSSLLNKAVIKKKNNCNKIEVLINIFIEREDYDKNYESYDD
jgi:hypothetical protein